MVWKGEQRDEDKQNMSVKCDCCVVSRAPVEMRGPWPRRSALPLAREALRRSWLRVRSPLSSGSYSEGKLPTPALGGDSHTNVSLTLKKKKKKEAQ